MNFKEWYENADIPVMDKNGEWYDAETGLYFRERTEKPREKKEVHPMMYKKLAEMKHDAERVILQEQYLDRCPKSVLPQKMELIEYARKLLSKRSKKAEFCKMYDMRTAVSRAENDARVEFNCVVESALFELPEEELRAIAHKVCKNLVVVKGSEVVEEDIPELYKIVPCKDTPKKLEASDWYVFKVAHGVTHREKLFSALPIREVIAGVIKDKNLLDYLGVDYKKGGK